MVFKIIIFLGVILALTIGAHLLLYKGLIRLFEITSPGLKAFLFIILLLLSLSFMASFFLLRWQGNLFTVSFYMFSATWMGLFLNLLLALLLSWTIIAAIWITGSYPSTKIIATVCLLLVVIISTYGVWNAFHPRVKKLEVGFENLPAQWENKVIVQLSGHTHAGQIFPFGNLTNLIYKGYDYGLKRIGNFSIYTTSGVGTWGPPMRTGSSPEIVLIKMKAL